MAEEEMGRVTNEKALEEKEEKPKEQAIPIPEEVLEKIPPDARREVKRAFSMMVSAGYVGPVPHPFARKLTEHHITKIIDNVEKGDAREFDDRKEDRKMTLTLFFAILIPVIGLIVFFTLTNRPEMMVPILSGLVGFGGGYGFGKSRK